MRAGPNACSTPGQEGRPEVALGATIYNFAIELSDVDRGVYEKLALKVACHPSEAEEHLVARVFAYCLEYTEGSAFSRGLADPRAHRRARRRSE